MEERLQKIMSAHGAMSRRSAEKIISDGRVTVNGITAQLGDKADAEKDLICIDGIKLKPKDKKIYIMLNKPVGYVTTMKDEQGRKNVTELIESIDARLYPVGRLDLNSEGLLIMTNDGEFANRIMHPSNEKEKTYHVTVSGNLSNIEYLSEPMVIDGYKIKRAHVKELSNDGQKAKVEIRIHEGRNRQIRKMCGCTGLKVKTLKRVAIGNVRLGNLKTGSWRNLTEGEVMSLSGK